jgi:hypothetical protein
MRYRKKGRSQRQKQRPNHQPARARAKQRHQYVDAMRYLSIYLILTGSQRANEQTESAEVDGIEFKVTGGESWLELGLKAKKRITVRKFKGMGDFRQC